MKIANLTPSPTNPRKITPEKLEMLSKSLTEFGDLSGIVFNVRSQTLVGGTQRTKVLPPDAEVEIDTTYTPPTRSGTVAEGHVTLEGERFKYRAVDWDDAKEKAGNIAANKGAGEWDYALLTENLNELDAENFDLNLTMFDEAERERLLGGWDIGADDAIEKIEENLDGITATIKVKCPQEIKDEVLIYLKDKLLETSFEGVEVV